MSHGSIHRHLAVLLFSVSNSPHASTILNYLQCIYLFCFSKMFIYIERERERENASRVGAERGSPKQALHGEHGAPRRARSHEL